MRYRVLRTTFFGNRRLRAGDIVDLPPGAPAHVFAPATTAPAVAAAMPRVLPGGMAVSAPPQVPEPQVPAPQVPAPEAPGAGEGFVPPATAGEAALETFLS